MRLKNLLTTRWRGRRYHRGTIYNVESRKTFLDMVGSGLFVSTDPEFRKTGQVQFPSIARENGQAIVLRDQGLGDLLMLMPAMRTVAQRFPQLRLTLATQRSRIQLLSFPWLFSTIAIEDLEPNSPVLDLRMYVERHRQQKTRTRVELFADVLGVPPSEMPITLPMRRDERRQALERLSGAGWTPDSPLAIVQLRSSAPIRIYDRGLTETLVQVLTDLGIWVVLIDVDPLLGWSGPRIIDATGRMPLTLLAEYVRIANAVVGPDSGPIHLAASVGTPSVALFTTWLSHLRVSTYDCLAFEPRELMCYPCNDMGCAQRWCTMWFHPLEVARAVCEVLAPRWDLTVPGDPPGVGNSILRRYGSPRNEEISDETTADGTGCYVPTAILS